MYDQLKELMAAQYYYGPVSFEEVKQCPVPHYATQINKIWYLGTHEPVAFLEVREIKAPEVLPV